MKSRIVSYFFIVIFFLGCTPAVTHYNINTAPSQNDTIISTNIEESEIEGGDVGNGGFVIYKNNQYIFLDYFLLTKDHLSDSYFEILAFDNFDAFNIGYLSIRNLSFIDPKLSEHLIYELSCFRHSLKSSIDDAQTEIEAFRTNTNEFPLHTPLKINENAVKNLCNDCTTELAVYFKSKMTSRSLNTIYTYDIRRSKTLHEHYYVERKNETRHKYCKETGAYFINSKLVSSLNEKNLAALAIHEALWAYFIRHNYILRPSTNILPLTQFIYKLPNTETLSEKQLEDLKKEFLLIWDSYEQI